MKRIVTLMTLIIGSHVHALEAKHNRATRPCKEREPMVKHEGAALRLFGRWGCPSAVAVAILGGLLVAATAGPAAAQFDSGSSGIHGAFPPVPQGGMPADAYYIVWNVRTGTVRYCSTYTLGTGLDQCDSNSATNVVAQIPNIPQGGLTTGVYEFTDVDIPSLNGSRFVVPVNYSPTLPLTILAGDLTIASGAQIYVSGGPGKFALTGSSAGFSVAGGSGGPGGFDGGASGNGGGTPSSGAAGFGPAGGDGGQVNASLTASTFGVPASAGPLNPSLTPLTGGSGGGGGAGIAPGALGCETNIVGFGGGSGGGGGGGLLLAASGRITFASNAVIHAEGGNGGANTNTGCRLYGGGGAGGNVRIVAQQFTGAGVIYVGGGVHYDGSVPRATGGFVRIETGSNTFTGIIDGAAGGSFISFPTAPIPVTQPLLRITSVAGSAAPASPSATLTAPDITFANPISSPVTVQIAASNVPLGTAVTIKVVPATGAPTTATSAGLAGSVASSTASATVTLPPGAGVITATATFNAADLSAALFPGGLPMLNGQPPQHVEVAAMADGTSRTYLVAAGGARFELGRGLR